MQYIALDAHKRYTLGSVERPSGELLQETRIEHERGCFKEFLSECETGSPVAVETVGNYYWIVDEIEEAGFVPRLVNARKAKLMMAQRNKTDKLDNGGINRLQRTGTLPTVWIPPGPLRDLRELTRFRMMLVGIRTKLKNRMHATLAKYCIQIDEVSDLFGVRGRKLLEDRLAELPVETGRCARQHLELFDEVRGQISETESRIAELIKQTPQMQLLKTLPGVGPILSAVIALEIGDIERFPSAEHLASYCGLVPRVQSSGGKTRYLGTPPDVNRYLKWAFAEAANVVVLQQQRLAGSHAIELYRRIRHRKGHGKAIISLARHLSEATYWVLHKKEVYREPRRPRGFVQARVSAPEA